MHIHIVLCCGVKRVLFTNRLSECWCCIINPYLFTKIHTPKYLGKRVTQHTCSHCSLLWCENGFVYQQVIRMCHIINAYLLTKFHTSKHLGKRVTQTCMFTMLFVVVRKGYCLPTSYQNVGVVSVYRTCLQSFMHPSTLVRELRKLACPIVMYGPKLFIVVFQKVRCLPKL